MGKKSTLKSALSSQQTRLKKKQDVQKSAQAAEAKGKKPSAAKGKSKATPGPIIIPFQPTDKVLLIGEGNFSFTRALVCDPPPSLQYLPSSNVVATAYDTEAQCYEKYPEAQAIVEELRAKGAEIIFGVDATKLESKSSLRNRKFDKVVWNFPHAGKGISDQDRNILSNQMLLLGFLRSAAHLLAKGAVPSAQPSRKKREAGNSDREDISADEAEGSQSAQTRGTILVTLRNVTPYTLWNLSKLAKSPPPPQAAADQANPRYTQLRSFVFHRQLWKGYEHRMTKGERAYGKGTTGQGGEDRTWEFFLRD